ncbi:MAG TPA: acyl-ACP desaturase [Acidimicrobiia bacterium]
MHVNDDAFLSELEPTAAELLNRHLATAKEWFPHQLVPWSRGRDFEPGEVWSEHDSPLPEAVRSALLVNLLTEDNLPYYTRTISRVFGDHEAFDTWTLRWTAEEGRHAIVIRDYLTVTRAIDPVALERARMNQVAGGVVPEPDEVADGLVYVSLQELATRISHRNTGKLLDDPVGHDIMARVAADENLHHLFYRDLTANAIELDPSRMVMAIERQVCDFAMPGTGIPDFSRHARAIAAAGVYDFASHHDQILVPVIFTHWKVDKLEDLTPEAAAARDRLFQYIERVGKAARRTTARRERSLATAS